MGIFDFKDGCVHCLVEIGFIQALFKHYKQHTAPPSINIDGLQPLCSAV